MRTRIFTAMVVAVLGLVAALAAAPTAQAEATFVGSASNNNASSSISVAAPTGVVAGDVQIAVATVGTSSEAVSTPSGWTLLRTLDSAGGSDSFETYIFVTETVTGAQSFTKSGSRAWQVVRLAYRGVDGVSASSTSASSSATTSHAIPGIMATNVGDMVVGGIATDGSSPSSQSFTPPTGWAERFDAREANEGVTNTVADRAATVAGSQSGTFTSSSSDYSIKWAIVLDATTSAPPPTNQPPSVNAGADATITLPATASLDGTVTDDGVPSGSTVSRVWFKESGPGDVSFVDAKATDTVATFSAAGTYVLRLVATDGQLSAYDAVQVTVNSGSSGGDTTPPETSITASPANPTTSTSASFSFTSSESGSTFECRLDGGAWGSCTSPKSYTGLATGFHTFEVRATDAASNVDPSPATRTWQITASATDAPSGPSGSWTLEFSDEFNGTSLDTTKWEPSWFNGGSMNNVSTSPNNVSVANGEARLQLGSTSQGALIHTGGGRGGNPSRYGMEVGDVVEARLWFPGNGTDLFNWPAWWVVDTYDGVSGVQVCGEHDIAEVLSGHDLTINYHSPSGAHNQGAQPGYWGDAWHTYTLHRKATSADVYWDGVLMESYPTDDEGCPIDVVLNVGKLSSNTAGVSPVTGSAGALRVDYVKAWEPAS